MSSTAYKTISLKPTDILVLSTDPNTTLEPSFIEAVKDQIEESCGFRPVVLAGAVQASVISSEVQLNVNGKDVNYSGFSYRRARSASVNGERPKTYVLRQAFSLVDSRSLGASENFTWVSGLQMMLTRIADEAHEPFLKSQASSCDAKVLGELTRLRQELYDCGIPNLYTLEQMFSDDKKPTFTVEEVLTLVN